MYGYTLAHYLIFLWYKNIEPKLTKFSYLSIRNYM